MCCMLSRVHLFAAPVSIAYGTFQARITGVGCCFLLQGIFPSQGSNPNHLHWQMGSLPLASSGKPKNQSNKNTINSTKMKVYSLKTNKIDKLLPRLKKKNEKRQINKIFFKGNVTNKKVGFPGGTSGKESAYECRRNKRSGFNLWARKIPWKRAWQPTPVFLPGESHQQKSLEIYSPWSHKESND